MLDNRPEDCEPDVIALPVTRRLPFHQRNSGRLAASIADVAATSLRQELAAWPKPGLVSYVDNGSHRDMDASMLETSIATLQPYFADLAEAGLARVTMTELRAIGRCAEAAMLAVTGGVNTHRGAIFGLGLLCAAAGDVCILDDNRQPCATASLGQMVAMRWGPEIMRGPVPLFSHGTNALRRHGAGGARAEAAGGFESVYKIGLPALRRALTMTGGDTNAACIEACFALIAHVGDTNLLHRGDAEGALFAAKMAQKFMDAGGVARPGWREAAASIHADFVARNLSPGGCADLLAMTLFVDILEPGAPV